MSARTCLTSVGIDILVSSDAFSAFGRRPAGEMEWPKNFALVAPKRAFEGESLILLCFRRRSKRERIVRTCAIGSESNTMTSSR